MSCYISSSNNRFYAAKETEFGVVPQILSRHRIPAVRLKAKQDHERVVRRDKTGSRTWPGLPPGSRTRSAFALNTYLAAWSDTAHEPIHGPLVEGAMGAPVQMFVGGPIASASGVGLHFAAPHGLAAGQAVAVGDEIRFVANVPDALSVNLNAAFAGVVTAGSMASATATYRLSTRLPGVSIFDYWTPSTAVQRIVAGAAVDRFTIKVNGDFHEFLFEGPATDILDSTSFESGQGGLTQFPAEPDLGTYDFDIVPGHLGQAWIGSLPTRFYTLTSAEIQIENGVDLRVKEFGANRLRCLVPGVRKVSTDFTIFAIDNDETRALYEAARQDSPVSVMLQLGTQAHQLCGIYIRSVVPAVPEFDDSETRLQWSFRGSRAQGVNDDEIMVAFA